MKNLTRFPIKLKYIFALAVIFTAISCASTAPRKCNGSRGIRVGMGVL